MRARNDKAQQFAIETVTNGRAVFKLLQHQHTHGFGHVLVCMPDKLVKKPIFIDAILKYNAKGAFSLLQSKKIYKYPLSGLFHFYHKTFITNIIFLSQNVH